MRPDTVMRCIEGAPNTPARGRTAVWTADGHFEVVRETPEEVVRLLDRARAAFLAELLTLCGGGNG